MPPRKPEAPQDAVAELYRQVLAEVGADKDSVHLDIANTPGRVAKMLREELLRGYRLTDDDLLSEMRMFPANGQEEMVVEVGIPFTSMCAHHMLPFMGTAYIGYLPGEHLLGLSKLPRILDHYAARLQMQEHLGAQCADFLAKHVRTKFAAVTLRAEHLCMSCRGVRKNGVVTVTTAVRPHPVEDGLLDEFYKMVNIGRY